MFHVSVASLVFGAGDCNSALPTVKLKLASECLSARELIARTVAEQIAELKRLHAEDNERVQQQLARQYLSADDIKAQAPAGKVALAGRQPELNVEREIQRALNAFERRCFRIFVDGHELRTPADTVALVDGASITFVRLIPLAGG